MNQLLPASAKPIKVSVDLVLVPVTVTDPMDRIVTHRRSATSLGIILDGNGSMEDKIERAREVLTEFSTTANPQDEFFLITFVDKPAPCLPFSQEPPWCSCLKPTGSLLEGSRRSGTHGG